MNEYVFMVQARGIQLRENVRNIGSQVLEQVVRGAYSINGTGTHTHTIQMLTAHVDPPHPLLNTDMVLLSVGPQHKSLLLSF